MLLIKTLLLSWAITVFGENFANESGQNPQAIGECGLEGIRGDTSPENPHILPPILDNLQDKARAWTHPIFGSVVGIAGRGPHLPYLTPSFSVITKVYFWDANEKTQIFVKEQKTRIMKRDITLRCNGGTQSDYSFQIMLQDGEPPVFGRSEYTFQITSDWNLERPISDGQVVTVSDTAIELETEPDKLRFVASKDILRVEAHPLWVLPNPARYHYRLDLYLNENANLEAGQNIQINLSALDEYNTGTVILNIIVS